MKLDEKAVALAAGLTGGILAAVCAILVWLFPVGMMNATGFWAHMDFSGMARVVTLTNFLGGIIVTVILGYATGWLFARIYNKLSK